MLSDGRRGQEEGCRETKKSLFYVIRIHISGEWVSTLLCGGPKRDMNHVPVTKGSNIKKYTSFGQMGRGWRALCSEEKGTGAESMAHSQCTNLYIGRKKKKEENNRSS